MSIHNILLRSRPFVISMVAAMAATTLVWVAAETGIDRALLMQLAWPEKHPRSDLLMLLRVWGSLWTWILIALAVGVQKRSHQGRISDGPRSVGITLVLAPMMAGGIAELLKLLIRRERPSGLEIYLFRAWSEQPWSTKGLGLPSSHSAVAFAGSMTLFLLYPRLALPALLIAMGCGVTRVASGAHYPSDVVVGAVVGGVTAALAAPPLLSTLNKFHGEREGSLRSGRYQR